jgi:hypothetical protein
MSNSKPPATPTRPGYLMPAPPSGRPSRLPDPKHVHREPFSNVPKAPAPFLPKKVHP